MTPETDIRYLPAPAVCARFGISFMSLHRWLAKPDMGFPKPYYFGRLRDFRLDELETWERDRVRRQSPVKKADDGKAQQAAEG